MTTPIEFYFEFASPYGYLASLRIDAIGRVHGQDVAWRPIMLGAAFKLTGMRPNVELPLKGDYLRHDVQRFARLWNVELRLPEVMPMNSLAASRAFWWQQDEDPETAKALAAAIYRAHWGEGRDMSRPEQVAEVAAMLCIDGDELIAAIARPEIKERLKTETELALQKGVFGSPFVIVDGEGFWGADRLDQVETWLARGGW